MADLMGRWPKAAFEEDALGDPVAGDELDVALEDAMVERLAIPPAHEVGPEALEDILQGPDARPFSHGVGEGDVFGEHIGNEDIIGVAPVVVANQRHDALRHGARPLAPHLVEAVVGTAAGQVPDQSASRSVWSPIFRSRSWRGKATISAGWTRTTGRIASVA